MSDNAISDLRRARVANQKSCGAQLEKSYKSLKSRADLLMIAYQTASKVARQDQRIKQYVGGLQTIILFRLES